MQEIDFVAKVGRIDNGWIVFVGASIVCCQDPEEIGSAIISRLAANKMIGDSVKDEKGDPTQLELNLKPNYYPKKGEKK